MADLAQKEEDEEDEKRTGEEDQIQSVCLGPEKNIWPPFKRW